MSMVPGEGQGLLRFLCRLLSIAVIVYGQDRSHDQCGVANSDSCKEVGASLLQTKSDKSLQPTATQAEVASKSKLTKQPGSVIALLSLAGAIQNQDGAQTLLSANMLGEAEGRSPSSYLVILAIVVAGCLFLGVVHVLNDPKIEKRESGPPQSNGFRVGADGQSSKDLSRAPSARETPLNSSRAVPSPRPTVDRSPRQPETLPSPTAGRHLCPGLVVPHGNECILAVPGLPTFGPDMAALTVQDLDGKSVIQAEVAMPAVARAGGGGRPIVVLRAGSAPRVVTGGQPQPLLAYCKASTEAGNRKSVFIYDARDELFSQITKDPANPRRFVLTSGRAGLQLSFEGDIEKHAVTVTDEQNHVVAETMPAVMAFNPAGVYYKLRVVSNVDVGLMLCALFAIDCLEVS